ncbi:MAG: zinc ribbon domain-containing protein [Anaerolineae bacterium]|nr:zinc ribbon domain-containing protein [Anaerolineae bacterium]
MPLYEYRCRDCDITFSKLRSFSRADEVIACPQCEGLNTKRALSLFASFSKGSDGSLQAHGGGGDCASCGGGHCGSCNHR